MYLKHTGACMLSQKYYAYTCFFLLELITMMQHLENGHLVENCKLYIVHINVNELE